jgi:para-nitrobenzyl esterase
LNMATMGQQVATYGGPIVDGKIVVETPQAALLSGHYWKMPIMIGANSADIGFPRWKTLKETWAAFGPDGEEAASLYDPTKSGNAMMVGWKLGADMMMVEPARFVAQTVSAAGQPAYEYRFLYVAESRRKQYPGALHATEIPFVFDTVKAAYGENLAPADEAAAKQTNAYWINFVKTGDPNGSGLPHWPAYSSSSDQLMNFTEDGPVAEADPWKKRLDLVEKLDAKPAESPKIISREAKTQTQ